MGIENYSVVKGKVVDRILARRRHDHYQIWVRCGDHDLRLAINAQSRQNPTDLLYLVDDNFAHPLTEELMPLPPGAHPLASRPGGLALDYVRGDLLRPERMAPLPRDVPGPNNDLNEHLDTMVLRTADNSDSWVYAWGSMWGPNKARDAVFRFRPSRGLHNVHMNQGARERFRGDNAPWQDGGVIFHFPRQNQWVAVFLAFQSQTFRTDGETGEPLEEEGDAAQLQF